MVTVQKYRVFSAVEPRGTGQNLARRSQYSFHIEIRTLYARIMFREKVVCLTICTRGIGIFINYLANCMRGVEIQENDLANCTRGVDIVIKK